MSVGDEEFMREALTLARIAQASDEIPIGAVVVRADKIIGRGFNQSISTRDPSAHAEVVAIRDAARKVDNYRLVDCSLYVSVEPCLMCVGGCLFTLGFSAWSSAAMNPNLVLS